MPKFDFQHWIPNKNAALKSGNFVTGLLSVNSTPKTDFANRNGTRWTAHDTNLTSLNVLLGNTCILTCMGWLPVAVNDLVNFCWLTGLFLRRRSPKLICMTTWLPAISARITWSTYHPQICRAHVFVQFSEESDARMHIETYFWTKHTSISEYRVYRVNTVLNTVGRRVNTVNTGWY